MPRPDDDAAYFTDLVADHHPDRVRLAYAMVGEIPLAHDVAQAAQIVPSTS
ncbi:MAG TPA: hypothetical protein VLA05_12440 [Coriobacteriia bacterium]|nr:hypothetical protein [Coriobacteriia bacterium]